MTATHPSPNPTTVDTPTDTAVVVTRTFDAPADVVFAMWTDPRHVPRWLLGPDGWTMPVCEIDLRPGGAWRYRWRRDDGAQEFGFEGTFLEVDPPRRLVHTQAPSPDMPGCTVTMALVERSGRTTMTMTIAYASREARDAALRTGMTGGMTTSYDRLDGYLASAR